MANKRWAPNAIAVADLWTVTLGGTWEVGDIIVLTIGSKDFSYSVTSTSIATIIPLLVTAWNALDEEIYPEFAEYTAGGATATTFTLTADTEGVPGTISIATTESNGGAADDQTVSITNTTPATGPNFWDNIDNWAEGAIPVDTNDVYIENSDVDILYGLAQTGVTCASLNIHKSYTGKIGLPRRSDGGYYEYRATYLAIKSTLVTIGNGAGAGSGRIKLDLSTAQTAVTINGSGSPIEDGVEAILIKGTHASNTLTITEGSVGSAVFAGEVSTWLTTKIGYEQSQDTDAKVRFGAGCTLTGDVFTQTGGAVELNSSVATLNRLGGTMEINGAAAATLIYNRGGSLISDSSGTFATVHNSAKFDKSRSLKAQTITTLYMYGDKYDFDDSNGVIVYTNPVQYFETENVGGRHKWGRHRKAAISNI